MQNCGSTLFEIWIVFDLMARNFKSWDGSIDDRYRANTAQRMELAKAVVPLIKNGDRLMIDAGSTTVFAAEGSSDFNSAAEWIKRTMFKQAADSILVVDSSKFEQKAFEHICPLDKLDHLVIDRAPPAKLAKALPQNNVAVHLPEKKNSSH